jgi:DNA mismatch repair protein MutS2
MEAAAAALPLAGFWPLGRSVPKKTSFWGELHAYSLNVLELPRILALLEEGALSEPGRRLCRELTPAWGFEEVSGLLAEVRELDSLEATDPLPLASFSDIGGLLSRSRVEGAILWPEELVEVLALAGLARRVKAHLGGRFPVEVARLTALARMIPLAPAVEQAIMAATGGKPELKDDASPELARLRASIRATRGRINQSLHGLMDGALRSHVQDRLITLRNDRYVLPVRTDAKGSVAGIVHDYSHSKATAYIEPMAVVEANNDLAILGREEKREEERILARLSALVSEAADDLAAAERGLAYLDLLSAKTALGRRLGGVVPQVGRAMRLELKKAYHPLLVIARRSKAIPIDVHLSPELRTLIISGPNAGGKTVTLKTVGLLALMAQAGLPIPAAEGSVLPVFPNVLATIGDEQDIEGDLSTFSARMGRTRELLELAGEGSLVLLDEIGTGTDPSEGAALAMAVLDELLARGSFCLITTHYHLLKAYGFLRPEVANVSLEFDQAGATPTFRLDYGQPGTSHGLETAERVGLPREVVERARGYLTDAERKSASLISELEETLTRLRAERGQVEQLREQAEVVKERRQKELDRLRERKDDLLLRERKRAEEIIGAAEREVRLIKKGLKDRRLVETTRLRQIRREMDERLRVRERRRELDQLSVGDAVQVASLNKEGRLAESPQDKERVAVVCGSLRMELPVWDLRPVARPASSPAPAARAKRGEPTPAPTPLWGLHVQPAQREVNLLGMRVDEALPIVDKSIDLAVVSGIATINIVHGTGTGRLRVAIREHLLGHAQVKSFRPGEGRQAAGVTVVEVDG